MKLTTDFFHGDPLAYDLVKKCVPPMATEVRSLHFNAGKNVVRLESATPAGMPALYKLRFTRPGG